MPKTASYRAPRFGESSLGQAYEAFRLRCQAQNLSLGTIGWYDITVRCWNRFLEAQEIQKAKQVTPTVIRAYLEDMRRRELASGYISRTYGALRCFFGFLARERLIPQNPFQFVEKPRMEKKLIRPLSAEQVRALLAGLDQKWFPYHTVWTLMVLILDTGLRISEVIELRLDQIDFPAGVLRVMGRKERSVPFAAQTCQALLEYARERGKGPVNAPQFFLGRTGKPLERCKVRQRMKRCGRKAGIEGVRVSPHTLRHTLKSWVIRRLR